MSSSGALRSVRHALAVAAAALIGGLGLAAPVAAHVSVDPTEAARDGDARVAFRVPSERDNANGEVVHLTEESTGGADPAHPAMVLRPKKPGSDTDQPAAGGGIGTGSRRFGANVAAVLALISVVIGGLALARSAGRIGTGNGRFGAIVAEVVGLIGMVLGGWHLARSAGGFGTGNGRAGAVVAMVVALIGMVLGGLALARSRHTGGPPLAAHPPLADS